MTEPQPVNAFHLQHRLASSLARHAQRVALSTPTGPVTYAELESWTKRLAGGLAAAGIAKGALVAVAVEQRSALVAALLASLRAGGIFMPLDLAYPVRRLAAMLAMARPACVVAEARTLARAADLFGRDVPLVCVDEPGDAGLGLNVLRAADYPDAPVVPLAPDDPCYLYFTSGSTGTPKGILGRHESLGHFVDWEIETFALAADSRVSQLTSAGFDPFLRDALAPLCAGGAVCLPANGPAGLALPQLVSWLNAAGVTHVHCVPTLFRALLRANLRPDDFPALRHVLLAGEMLFGADVARWQAVFGERVQLTNLYGPTETTLVKLAHRVRPDDAHGTFVPVGRPMPGATALLVDEAGQTCPTGVIGEIHIQTRYRSLGYYGQPEQTRAAFSGAEQAYRTGDLGRRLADGSLELVGRRDDQVKVHGVRVELAEIEGALRRHPAVADAAVRHWQDAGADAYLCAYLVLREPLPDQALRAHLLEQLPWTLVPALFMRLAALPLTPNGKLDRPALPDARAQRERPAAYAAPSNAVEHKLVEIWQAVLPLPSAPGVNDDFLALGGDSLQAVQIMVRLNSEYDIEVPIMALFAAPTIAGLAQVAQAVLDEASETPALAGLDHAYESGEI